MPLKIYIIKFLLEQPWLGISWLIEQAMNEMFLLININK